MENKQQINIPTSENLKVVFNKKNNTRDLEAEISAYSYFFKPVFDFVFALFGVVLISPLLILLYTITVLSSKGPGFYHQKRVGLYGKTFYIFKFRSMKTDSEQNGPQLTYKGDKRLTKWGLFMRKYYLDELPQLFNVLKGDMSLVGPRPERRYFIEKIQSRGGDFYSLLQVKPGITSLGQIRYGYAHNVDQMLQRLKYEQLYLKRMSARTDFNILISTTFSVVKAKGE